MKTEELILDAKNFFDTIKKDIGNSIRIGKSDIMVDFEKLTIFSPNLAKELLENPYETFHVLEESLEEGGLIIHPRVLVKNMPNDRKKEVSQLTISHLQKLVEVTGRVVRRDKVRHKIVNVKYECPSCGTIISVLQITDKVASPKRCGCGRRDGFKHTSREIISVLGITIQDIRTNDMIHFDEIFNEESDELLQEGNTISVRGILIPKDVPNSREIYFEIEPHGIQLIQASNGKVSDVEIFIENLRRKENEGAYLFEELIGKLFEKKGYKVSVTKKSGDYGIDVIAEKGAEKIAIQCRLLDSSDKIGNSAIQKALGGLVSPYNATKLIFITTAGGYTSQAIEQTKSCKVPVELWDRVKIIAELKAHMYDLEEGWNLLNEYEEKKRKFEQPPTTSNEFDIERIAVSLSTSPRARILLVRETLKKLESRLGKLIPVEEIIKELEGKMDEKEVNDALDKLMLSGDVFHPRKGYIQKFFD